MNPVGTGVRPILHKQFTPRRALSFLVPIMGYRSVVTPIFTEDLAT
jgi:hypothetical protein